MKAVDVMGFAGSMACGVDQAGFDVVAKREPSAFGGFGVESLTYNMPWVEPQVADQADWDLPADKDIDLVYGCPPCSGFSALSIINAKVHSNSKATLYGADADINECMGWFVDYAARVKPPVAVFESVGPAFTVGREWMETLFYRLREKSGLDYQLTHVNMDAGLVGGDVTRKRYFFVAHLQPFGVGLDFVSPRSFMETVGDLGDTEQGDYDWGHFTDPGAGVARTKRTIEWLEAQGREWRPGTRLPDNLEQDESGRVIEHAPDFWYKSRPTKSKRYGDENGMSGIFSHWFSTDAFSPLRWRPDKPFGVVVAATLFRAVHPVQARNLTYREAARFMSLPDTWSMRVLTEKNKPAEIGKAIPAASAKWIAHWAKMSLEGTPGEYAGRDTADPLIRVITVNSKGSVAEIMKGNDADAFYADGEYSDPDPKVWLIDRKSRPAQWWQRDDELGIFSRPEASAGRSVSKTLRAGSTPAPVATQASAKAIPARSASKGAEPIARVQPEQVVALLEELNLSKADAAARLGVSPSRINELVTNTRPNSWLNASRWEEVQAALRG